MLMPLHITVTFFGIVISFIAVPVKADIVTDVTFSEIVIAVNFLHPANALSRSLSRFWEVPPK